MVVGLLCYLSPMELTKEEHAWAENTLRVELAEARLAVQRMQNGTSPFSDPGKFLPILENRVLILTGLRAKLDEEARRLYPGEVADTAQV